MRCYALTTALAAATAALAETIKITATEDNKFDPELSTAAEGDILEFHFAKGNHSVVRGEFDSINGPCAPINDDGFYSGFFAVDSGESDKVFRVTLNSSDPVVFYSSQGQECKNGMVGAVNSNDTALSDYKDDASKIASGVTPSKVFGGVVADADSDSGDNDDSNDSDDDGDDDSDSSSDDDGDSGAATLRGAMGGVLAALGVAFVLA